MNNLNLSMETFEQFAQGIKYKLKTYYDNSREILINTVNKNNGIVLTGITVKNNTCNMAPTLYLESFYDMYLQGISFDKIVDNIIDIINEHEKTIDFDVNAFLNYEKVRERIVYKLINRIKNEKILSEIPYFDFLDMAIVFYFICEDEFDSEATILIKNEHLKSWGKNKFDLLEAASINTKTILGSEIKNLHDVMKEILSDKFKAKYDDNDYDSDFIDNLVMECLGDKNTYSPISMYVLTNKKNMFGAACILDSELLDVFSEKINSNIIILPSSIHEVILVPEKEVFDKSNLENMVKEINENEVAEEEVLSDSVYIYQRDKKQIEIMNC